MDSILNQHRREHSVPKKIGLYTSPHLISVRDRIRINSEPIREDLFARYFFEVWDALEASAAQEGRDPRVKPVYFRFLTLMSWHVFLKEGVDAAIYEVGVGGAWDSTNVVEKPVVTGITTLGIDHVAVLGDTLAKISWHKAGIFKKGVPAFSVSQAQEAVDVLEERAAEIGVNLHFIDVDPFISKVEVTPNAEYQRGNISLAIALVVEAGKKLGLPGLHPDKCPEVFKDGIENTVWRGRCETKFDGRRKWHLDGAHTVDSLKVAAQWFARQSKEGTFRILLFNQQSRPEADDLLRRLQLELINDCGLRFDHVIFSTNVTRKSTGYRIEFENRNTSTQAVKELAVQKRFAEVWAESDQMPIIHTLPTIQDAIELIEELSEEQEATDVFVTGSIHLVGGILALLEGAASPATS
ncbi:Folylpolyglutamate synthetase [Exophiala oligosperma]